MQPFLQRTDLRIMPPVIGPASKHWSVVTCDEPLVQVGAMVKVSYEPYKVYAVDLAGDVVRKALFERVSHALRWLDRHCHVRSAPAVEMV